MGREFTRADVDGAPRVAIVNEAFAREFGLGRDAVGKRMAIGRTNTLDMEIVGLVRDARYSEVKDPAPPMLFTPYRQEQFGAPIGIAAALGLGRLASSLLYGVDGSDPGVVAGAAALLAAGRVRARAAGFPGGPGAGAQIRVRGARAIRLKGT